MTARDFDEVASRADDILARIEAVTPPATWETLTPAQKDEALRRSLVILGKLIRLVLNWRE